MTTPEPWTILADIAGHLQVSEDTVLRWIAKRKLPAHRVGRSWERINNPGFNSLEFEGIRPVSIFRQ